MNLNKFFLLLIFCLSIKPLYAFPNSKNERKINIVTQSEFEYTKIFTTEGFLRNYRKFFVKSVFEFENFKVTLGIKNTNKELHISNTKNFWENQLALELKGKLHKNFEIFLWGGKTFREYPKFFTLNLYIAGIVIPITVHYQIPRESFWIGGGFSLKKKNIRSKIKINYYEFCNCKSLNYYRWELEPSLSYKAKDFNVQAILHWQKFHFKRMEKFINKTYSNSIEFSVGKSFKYKKVVLKPSIFASFGDKYFYSKGIFVEDFINLIVKKEYGMGISLKNARIKLDLNISYQKVKVPNYVKSLQQLEFISETKKAISSLISLEIMF